MKNSVLLEYGRVIYLEGNKAIIKSHIRSDIKLEAMKIEGLKLEDRVLYAVLPWGSAYIIKILEGGA